MTRKKPPWRRSTDVYDLRHQRLRYDRGSATQFPCHDCGRAAREWSLRSDPDGEIQVCLVPGEGAMWWSPLDSDYLPKCLRCHRSGDAAARRAFEASLDWEPEIYGDLQQGIDDRAEEDR